MLRQRQLNAERQLACPDVARFLMFQLAPTIQAVNSSSDIDSDKYASNWWRIADSRSVIIASAGSG